MRIHRREMGLLLLGGIIIIGFLYYLFIVSPAISRQESLIGYIAKKEAELTKVKELKAQWGRFKKSRIESEKILRQRGGKFTLLSFLEGISREVGIDKRIQYIKPLSYTEDSGTFKRVGMEMKLDNIDIDQLVRFLHRVEYSGKLISIKRIRIQRMSKDKDSALKVTLQVNTFT
jgi:hypothetical protein